MKKRISDHVKEIATIPYGYSVNGLFFCCIIGMNSLIKSSGTS